MVDTLGLVLAVVVHSAGIQDRDGAKLVIALLKDRFPRLKLIWADGGYAGQLIKWVASFGNWVLEIVKRSDDQKGFVVGFRVVGWSNARLLGYRGIGD